MARKKAEQDIVVESTKELTVYERCKGKVTIKDEKDCIPTGITLLNLFLSNNRKGGFLKHTIASVSGTKASGKTFFFLNMLATLIHDPAFAEYKTIYEGAENGNFFDVARLFGEQTLERMENEIVDKKTGNIDTSLEGWFYKMLDRVNSKTPFVSILDSVNALQSESEKKNYLENKDAYEKGKAEKGEFKGAKRGMAHSDGWKNICPNLNNGSFMAVVRQVRAVLDPMSRQKVQASDGGFSLEHYVRYELMLKNVGAIKEEDLGKVKNKIGQKTEINIVKNSGTGKMDKLPVPVSIYYDYGIDDLTTNLDYLKMYGILKYKTGNGYYFNDPKIDWYPRDDDNSPVKYQINAFKAFIEDNDLEDEVAKLVEEHWLENELHLKLKRKKKFK